MKIKKFLLITLVFFSLSIAFVSASYDYTTNWNVNNVRAINYQCSDSGCYTLGTKIFDSTSASNSIIISYPVPSPQYGYATYWFANCYQYQEMVFTPTGSGSYTGSYSFGKYSNCKSIANSLTAPATINLTQAIQISVDVQSAISEVNQAPHAEPSDADIVQNFLSSQTNVILEIRDSGNNLIHSETKQEYILRDTSKTINFQYTPTLSGQYTIKVITQVPDCKCASSLQDEKTTTLTVNAIGDIYFDNAYTNPSLVYDNTTPVQVYFTTHNSGPENLNVPVEVYLDSVLVAGINSLGVDSGTGLDSISITGPLSIGTHNVNILIDPLNTLPSVSSTDFNYSFNVLNSTIQIIGITNPQLSSAVIYETTSPVVFYFNTYNTGLSLVTSPIQVLLDGVEIQWMNPLDFSPGQNQFGIGNLGPFNIGTHNISILIDPQDTISGINTNDFFYAWNVLQQAQCSVNSDCGNETYSNNYCNGLNVVRNKTSPTCVVGVCGSTMVVETLQTCSFACQTGVCVNQSFVCGNNILETGEECDDGNIINGDGCSSVCENEGGGTSRRGGSHINLLDDAEPIQLRYPVIDGVEDVSEIKINFKREPVKISFGFILILGFFILLILLLILFLRK